MLEINQTIILLIFASFFLLICVLVFVLLLYLKLNQRYQELELEKGKDPKLILARAEFRAQKILEQANQEAKKLVEETENFLRKHQAFLSEELRRSSDAYLKVYNENLSQIQKDTYKMIQNIPNDIKTYIITAIDGFRLSLSHDAAQTQQKIAQKLEESLISAQHEIERYKEERKREIDEKLFEFVKEVVKRVLGKQISIDEHEKLVLKALEEAKRQGFF